MNDLSQRIYWLGAVMGVLFLILFGGLLTRQLIQYPHFKKLEARQSLRRVLLPAPRGLITDRNGNVLAENQPRFSLIVYLGELRAELREEQIKQVRRAREAGQTLSRDALLESSLSNVLRRHLGGIEKALGTPIPVELEKLRKHYQQKPLMPYTLLENLSLEQFARLTELLRVDAPLQLQVRSLRNYPQGGSLCHVLGFVSMRDPEVEENALRTFSTKDQVGINGIEKQFDETLSGSIGEELWLVDPAGFRCEPTRRDSARPGRDVALTVDIKLQKAVEAAFGGKIGAAAALDVHTGEVLALCSRPGYNPNELLPRFSAATDAKIRVHNGWINRAIQGLYPSGSTFKLITALAAMDAGVLDLDETISCSGSLMVGNRAYPCNKKDGHGPMDLRRAIEKSCNVYFYTMGLRAGPEALMRKAREYGFDSQTHIELPGETTRMLVPSPEWKKRVLFEPWYAGDTANLSIGQGYLLVTPLQMAAMTASLARGDKLTPVTIVKKEQPAALPSNPLTVGQKRLIEGMKAAAETGTARLVRVEGLEIAGKTGTAQVKANGEDLTLAWFVGFAPIENPQVAIAVVVEGTSPDDQYAGGTTAAPIARSFFEEWQKNYSPSN